jgi:hypothetical protein
MSSSCKRSSGHCKSCRACLPSSECSFHRRASSFV